MKKAKVPRRPAITRRDFIGAQMRNILYQMVTASSCSPHISINSPTLQKEALELVEKWDAIAVIHLNNPIVLAELKANYDRMKP